MAMIVAFRSIVAVALALICSAPVLAQPLYDTPVYHPESKRYFELVKVSKAEAPTTYVPELSWAGANKFASQRRFKGAKGQLAVVDSPAIHMFLLSTFKPDVWAFTGLRYYCRQRKLVWVSGKVHTRNDFQAWHVQWDQSETACLKPNTDVEFLPIVYTSAKEGFRWVAKGPAKRYYAYFVEYRTGEQ
jgi:hypothetical protein